ADKSSTFSINAKAAADAEKSIKFSSYVRFFKDFSYRSVYVFLVFVFAVIGAVAFIRVPGYLGQIIDEFLSAIISSVIKGVSDADSEKIFTLSFYAVALVLVHTATSFLQGFVSTSVSSKYCENLRNRTFEKTGTVTVSYIDVHQKKSIDSLITEQVDMLSQSLNILVSQNMVSVILVFAIAYYIFSVNTVFGVIVVFSILLQVFLQSVVSYLASKKKRIRQNNTTEFNEIFTNLTTVKNSGSADDLYDDITADENMHLKSVYRARFFESVQQNYADFATGISIVLIVLAGSFFVIDKQMTAGELISVVIFAKRLSSPLAQCSGIIAALKNTVILANNIFGYLDAPDESQINEKVIDADDVDVIEFRNVNYRYPFSVADIFSDFCLELPDRGITQLAGVTGVGKTTMLKLMLGFYKPSQGTVTFNGIPVSNLDITEYRNRFSVITQEASLFEMTIGENIAYPCAEFDKSKADEIIERIGASEIISSLSDGYDTMFNSNPKSLSDGQIQMLLLARALYNDKKYI
ncbi:MAG: ABC transporter ATP-binding protein, partial [Clostridia bacterium]|nr:ABC transporter ATP-binding protein [Clostridia bacterium]